MINKRLNQKFIVCKKIGKEKWLAYEKSIFSTDKECFDYIISKFTIKKGTKILTRYTYKKYLEDNKEILEDISLETLLNFDCIDIDFFKNHDIFQFIDDRAKEDYLVYEKGKYDYGEILRTFTRGNFDILRIEKMLSKEKQIDFNEDEIKMMHILKIGRRKINREKI